MDETKKMLTNLRISLERKDVFSYLKIENLIIEHKTICDAIQGGDSSCAITNEVVEVLSCS